MLGVGVPGSLSSSFSLLVIALHSSGGGVIGSGCCVGSSLCLDFSVRGKGSNGVAIWGFSGFWFYGCCCVGGVLGCSALRYSGVGMFQVLVETFLVRGGDGFWLGGLVFRYTVGGDFSLNSQGLEGGSPFPSHASE